MDQFEYVVVLTSLILGLGIARILSGFADMLSNFKHTKFYGPHSLYVGFIFLLHIQEWWINYEYAADITSWTLKVVLLILAYPITLFIMARMIFPTGIRSHENDFKQYYYDQWRFLFTLGTCTVILSLLHNFIISGITPLQLIPHILYLITYLTFIIFNIKNHWAHLVFQSVTFIILIIYIITNEDMLDFYG